MQTSEVWVDGRVFVLEELQPTDIRLAGWV